MAMIPKVLHEHCAVLIKVDRAEDLDGQPLAL
jgi:hypothetical protein